MADPLPGLYGKNYFTLEFVSAGWQSWFRLELDTHAPVVSLGDIQTAYAGELLIIPYTITEPSIRSARLLDPSGAWHDLTVTANEIRYAVPSDFPEGNSTLYVTAIDAVGNQALTAHIIEITGGAPVPVPEIISGGGRTFTYMPITGQRIEILRISGEVGAVRQRVFSVSGSVEAQKEVSFGTEGMVAFFVPREVEFSVSGIRESSVNFSNIVREDEELLLYS